ncbi:LuxR C-terminal-related transcriptional regulator [Gracilimonas tropica]|uniref:LuxR C-terminal-related transcriptional regulator n=1 Tax=Gracilimonas tropica TaxID=454600 RepID=UPI00039B3BA3|nr:LuxR C-terminal-related transcriptional regulator [Gracilimonas tropica]
MKLVVRYLFILICSFSSLYAQQIPQKGVPLLKGFTPDEFDHMGKIWDIDTAPNGIVYMAANKGLLEYDGETWKNYNGSEGIIRSVVAVNDSILFTGSDRDFGIWKRNRFNEFEYTSLYPFKEDLTDISEEFWNVHYLDETPLFISEYNIYIYKEQNLTKIPAPTRIAQSFQYKDQVFIIDEADGLFQLENLSPRKKNTFGEEFDVEFVGIYKYEDELIFVSQNKGLLRLENGQLNPFEIEITDDLKTANVFSFEQISDAYLAFGTILNGLYITDLEGNLIHHINKSKGLQNNTILSIHYSSNNKLWLGMDYGISAIDLSDNYTVVLDNLGTFGTAHDALLKDDMFYLGTNQGLYTSKWEGLNNSNEFYDFDLIDGSEGQVWSLNIVDDQVWVAHDRGLFVVKNSELERVGEKRGILTLKPYGDYLLAGTYNGILIYERSGENWQFLRQMELIAGSVDQIFVNQNGVLWINIPNYGVIRADLNQNLYPGSRDIFEVSQFEGMDHYLEKNENGIALITDQYRYEYLPDEKKFKAYPKENSKSSISDLLFPNGAPTPLNEQYQFYPVYNGFALKDLSIKEKESDSTFNLIFRNAWAFNNDQRKKLSGKDEVSYKFNNLRVKAIVPNQAHVTYQFWSDKTGEWSNLSTNNTLEIIGLSFGEHTIRARALVDGMTSNIATFNFKVMPPWYHSWYAYLSYLGLVLVAVYLFYSWFGLSLDKQKKRMLETQRKTLKKQQEHFQQRLKRVEEEKLRAEYKNLKAELKNKTIELATKAKENDEKNKVLKKIKDKFEKIQENPASLKRRAVEIKHIIDENLDSKEDDTFEIQIDELHQDFFDSLRHDFPDLTRYDLRLCAYIKIGFDSKEIADLLNIKPSSVYISRSRLRKKLDIETDKDLHSYLNSIES